MENMVFVMSKTSENTEKQPLQQSFLFVRSLTANKWPVTLRPLTVVTWGRTVFPRLFSVFFKHTVELLVHLHTYSAEPLSQVTSRWSVSAPRPHCHRESAQVGGTHAGHFQPPLVPFAFVTGSSAGENFSSVFHSADWYICWTRPLSESGEPRWTDTSPVLSCWNLLETWHRL